ncbi:MAG: T9SS type A sorting domain-containing protein [Bacteroidales bacterium]|nr:T9SS type A sorting domain-containing protein [Bacteroidales bacterium]
MKKMKLLALLMLLTSATAIFPQNSAITVISGTKNQNLYARGLAPDGSYLTGQAGSQHHMFVWKKDGNILIESDTLKLASNPGQMGSNAFSVNASGLVAGLCPNPAYLYTDVSEEGQYGSNNVPTAALFDFETKKWNFLPVVSSRPLIYTYGSRAHAISDNGRIVAGGQNPGGETMRLIAGYWKKDTVSGTYTYTALKEDMRQRGSLVKTMSGDGLLMGGFEADNFSPKPALWKSNDNGESYSQITVFGQSIGVVEAVSRNGKYALLSIVKDKDFGYAALYDIETQELTEIHTGPAAALAVSDNGVVVGHFGGLYYGNQLSTYNVSPGRHIDDALNGGVAYIFTKEMGAKPLKEFFDENSITYPSGFVFKAATGISTDGRKICGHGSTQSFYAEIPEIVEKGVFSVTNLSIESPAYGSILLTWDSVPENPNFTGYKVFNADNTTSPIRTVTETSCRIDGLANGRHSFYVVSSYTSKDAEKTRTLSYLLSRTNIPIFEEFGNNIDTSWNISYNTSANSSWFIDQLSGYPPACAKFVSPMGGFYNESLTSPYFDAVTSTAMQLSFMLGIPGSELSGATDEMMYVEIFADNAWDTLEEIHALTFYSGWHSKSYDISQYAGKENLRIRFRTTGESVGATLNWFLDNVEVTDQSSMFVEENPLNMSANYVEEENKVHVQWSDPHGFVDLRYSVQDSPEEVVSAIGNKGKSIIAVNKYMAGDLSAFEGYKLTSISFLRGMNPDKPFGSISEPTFKWYLSQGDERLFDGEVGSTEAGVWKTIILDNPVTIDNTKPLYYGVEVTQHDELDWPLATGYVWKEKFVDGIIEYHGNNIVDGRANLFSEDGGSTWDKLSNHLEDGDPQIFLIRATLAKDPDAVKKDRLMGYRVFRNNVNMLGTGNLTSLNNYTDTLPPSGMNCYEIQAYYTTGSASDGVEDCVDLSNISNEQVKQANVGLKVYPSFVQNGETVTVETDVAAGGTLRLYDAKGKLLYVRLCEPQAKQFIQMNVAPGVYLLQFGNYGTTKLIVK